MIESPKLVLKNNNVLFDDHMYLKLLGTAMGTKCAHPCACLNVDYLEETKLFTKELTKNFNESECMLTMELLQRYMDDGFIFWPLNFENNIENFKTCLINMHPSIKFTLEKPEIIHENEKKVQVLTFLVVKTILHEDNSIKIDVYCSPTNTDNFLPYNSAHLDHTQNNIP